MPDHRDLAIEQLARDAVDAEVLAAMYREMLLVALAELAAATKQIDQLRRCLRVDLERRFETPLQDAA